MSKWIEYLNIGTKTTKPTETACRTKGEETEKDKLEQQKEKIELLVILESLKKNGRKEENGQMRKMERG